MFFDQGETRILYLNPSSVYCNALQYYEQDSLFTAIDVMKKDQSADYACNNNFLI